MMTFGAFRSHCYPFSKLDIGYSETEAESNASHCSTKNVKHIFCIMKKDKIELKIETVADAEPVEDE